MTAPVPVPRACDLPDGAPHPDPALAARGWQVQGGIYVRSQPAASEKDHR